MNWMRLLLTLSFVLWGLQAPRPQELRSSSEQTLRSAQVITTVTGLKENASFKHAAAVDSVVFLASTLPHLAPSHLVSFSWQEVTPSPLAYLATTQSARGPPRI